MGQAKLRAQSSAFLFAETGIKSIARGRHMLSYGANTETRSIKVCRIAHLLCQAFELFGERRCVKVPSIQRCSNLSDQPGTPHGTASHHDAVRVRHR